MKKKMSKIHEKTGSVCLICDEKIDIFVTLHKTRRQTHSLCLNCVLSYLSPIFATITSKLRRNIRRDIEFVECPGAYHSNLRNRCKNKINITKIPLPLNTDLSTDLFRITYVLKSPLAFICPNNLCLSVIDVDANYNDSKLHCLECNSNWCRNCLVAPYHDRKTCLEYEIESKSSTNAQYIEEMNKKGLIKFCPECKVPILKNDGCSKMSCQTCHCKFCWRCGEKNIDYSHFNPKSGNDCANHLWN